MQDPIRSAGSYVERFEPIKERPDEGENIQSYIEAGYSIRIAEALSAYDNCMDDFVGLNWSNVINDEIIVDRLYPLSCLYINFLNSKTKAFKHIVNINAFRMTQNVKFRPYHDSFVDFIANQYSVDYLELIVAVRLEESYDSDDEL